MGGWLGVGLWSALTALMREIPPAQGSVSDMYKIPLHMVPFPSPPVTDTPTEYKDRGPYNDAQGQKKVCKFRREWLENCSGLNDPSYGYKDGKPCILVKLNRIIGFKPQVSIFLPFLAEATDWEKGLAADLLCLLFGLSKEISIKPFLQRINCETNLSNLL